MKLKADIDKKVTELVMDEVYVDKHYSLGKSYIKKIKAPVIVDLGAYIGITPIYFNVPNSTIFAVEANPDTYNCLVENTKEYKNIHPIYGAIGFSNETRMMYKYGNSVPMEFYPQFNNKEKPTESYSVPGFTFEQLLNNYVKKHIDLLKIDIEGCEYELFLSDEFVKYRNEVDFIIGEAHRYPIMPHFLPEIFTTLGFDFKFLPYKNYVDSVIYEYKGKKYKLVTKLNTLFVAKRKNL